MEMSAKPGSTHSFCIPDDTEKMRIDLYLARQFPAYSRNFFQQLIEDRRIAANNVPLEKPSFVIKAGDQVCITFPEQRIVDHKNLSLALEEKKVDVEVIAEHEHFLIIYKPANFLVHAPSARSSAVTLVDWLVVHYPDIASVGYTDRPGIVHRIDKDTTGILVVPRTPYAHNAFSKHFKNRSIKKLYLAVVEGHPPASGTIDFPIGRDPHAPQKMTFFSRSGLEAGNASHIKKRDATTHYKVRTYFKDSALIEAHLITGRTHQIRVHCAAIGHPLVGDPVYGNKSKLIKRQALHAYSISFDFDGVEHTFCKEPPTDFADLINSLTQVQ